MIEDLQQAMCSRLVKDLFDEVKGTILNCIIYH